MEKGYCMKCKKMKEMKSMKKVKKGNRLQLTGVCPVCGTKMSAFAKN